MYKFHIDTHTPWGYNKLELIMRREVFMTASLALGAIMGIIFKPRSWCQVCPMGYALRLWQNPKKWLNSWVFI